MPTITEVYNNIPCREGLTPDWGFSCLVEEAGLLFDTGERGDILLANMQALGIDPAAIRHLVLSHDHIGGLAATPSMEVNRPRRLLRRDALADPGPDHPRPDGDNCAVAVTGPPGYPVVTGCAHPHISRIMDWYGASPAKTPRPSPGWRTSPHPTAPI